MKQKLVLKNFNEIDEPLERLTKKEKEKTQNTGIKNAGQNFTMDPAAIKRYNRTF